MRQRAQQLIAAALGLIFCGQIGLAQAIGPETRLPLPRYVSLKATEGNVRRGPSLTHRIDWVYKRRALPLRITAEHGHWRRVEDHEGFGGWIHYSLLSGQRTVVVAAANGVALRSRPAAGAHEVALLEPGVVARLGRCTLDWCRLTVGGHRGWTRKTELWGVEAAELRD